MKMVAGGPAAVNVISTSPPDCPTVNEFEALPPGSTVPLNVAVLRIGAGDATVELPLLSHPADSATDASTTQAAINGRRM